MLTRSVCLLPVPACPLPFPFPLLFPLPPAFPTLCLQRQRSPCVFTAVVPCARAVAGEPCSGRQCLRSNLGERESLRGRPLPLTLQSSTKFVDIVQQSLVTWADLPLSTFCKWCRRRGGGADARSGRGEVLPITAALQQLPAVFTFSARIPSLSTAQLHLPLDLTLKDIRGSLTPHLVDDCTANGYRPHTTFYSLSRITVRSVTPVGSSCESSTDVAFLVDSSQRLCHEVGASESTLPLHSTTPPASPGTATSGAPGFLTSDVFTAAGAESGTIVIEYALKVTPPFSPEVRWCVCKVGLLSLSVSP